MLRFRIRIATAVVLTAACVALVAPSHAQQGKQKQDELRRRGAIACDGDVEKLCKEFQGKGDMIVLQCLQKAKAELSGTCTKFLTEVGQLN